MKIITLMTDFGLRDGYDGVMKGVIYRIAPDVQIADVSHTIAPQNVLEGCLTLGRAYRYFPAGTVHVAVVDPGVGTHRRPIAAFLNGHYFVCPDNGLLSVPLAEAEATGAPAEVVHLDRPRYWLSPLSNVFHGRDIFSPVGAHLANGVPLQEVGSPINDPIRLALPRPIQLPDGLRGEVVAIDHFGNLSTNINEAHLAGRAVQWVQLAAPGGVRAISGLSRTFGDHAPGQLIAIIGADGELTVSIVQGSAARETGAQVGDRVDVLFGAP